MKSIRKVGTDNYYIKNCPVLIPKENLKFFRKMQKAVSKKSYLNFGNVYKSK